MRAIPVAHTALEAGEAPSAELGPREMQIANLESFELDGLGDCTRLSTETRVQPTDSAAARAFRPYWWAIRAGSGLIRRDVLHAVRQRAEHDASSAPVATQSS